MKKTGFGLMIVSICLMLSGCSLRCILGHSWEEETCTTPKTCIVCGKVEGTTLSPDGKHHWEEATCTKAKVCTVCGETEGSSLGHDWNDCGECERCEEHKEYGNSYGYFSELELYSMAKDAIQDAVYPAYVLNFETFPIRIEKATDEKLGVGMDSFAVVSTADFSSNGSVQHRAFAVIVEPRTATKYVYKDHLVQ